MVCVNSDVYVVVCVDVYVVVCADAYVVVCAVVYAVVCAVVYVVVCAVVHVVVCAVAHVVQALVDFRGYRLLAMPVLPLRGGRHVYGSSDGGLTVRAEDSEFNDCMRTVAAQLHLGGHVVGGTELFGCGDLEGHIGADGHMYLLDLV